MSGMEARRISLDLKRPCCCYIPSVEYARRGGTRFGHTLDSSSRPLYLELLQPAAARNVAAGNAEPVPIVIFTAGGAFRTPLVKMRVPWMARLAELGFLVAMPEYRGTEYGSFPVMEEDLISAIRYMRRHGAEYGGDPDKIVLFGGSAGAHISLLAAYAPERFTHPGDDLSVSAAVSGVIALYGPNDPIFDGAEGNPVAVRLAGSLDPDEIRRRLESAVVTRSISADRALPPTLLLHGDRDAVVPLAESERLFGALTEAGQDAELLIVEGAGHADMRFFEPEANEIYAAFIRRATKTE